MRFRFFDAGLARLYLAEIDEIHAGKAMHIELFDPSDGIDSVRIVDPHDNYLFQDRTLRIVLDLDGYSCQAVAGQPENCWWQVEYEPTASRMRKIGFSAGVAGSRLGVSAR